jgi:SAM-dependent methyltransferase
MRHRDWIYDDRHQVGLDFSDRGEVAEYDRKQADGSGDNAALLAILALKPEDVIVDLGCGTGAFICAAARIARRALAIDISEAMLEATAARAKALGLTNLECTKASFLTWDASAHEADVIVSKFALHHLPDFWKAVALRRMYEALKPGGRLFIRDVVFSCRPEEIEATIENWIVWTEAHTGYRRADIVRHMREEHSTFGWIMEGLLAAAGFRIIRSDYDPGMTYADYLLIKPTQATFVEPPPDRE